MADRPYNVLFLCTGNTAGSIMAEGILRRDGAGRFNAFSAGRQPKGAVNPFAQKVLRNLDHPTDGFRSKRWDKLTEPHAPVMDLIFTVCDSAAGESCPARAPGFRPLGHRESRRRHGLRHREGAGLRPGLRYLKNRMTAFLALPMPSLDQRSLTHRLKEIGRLEGVTPGTVLPFDRHSA